MDTRTPFQRDLCLRAELAVEQLIDENPNANARVFGRATLEHIARLAYLDGYLAGHTAAMKEAGKIADEVLR